MKRTAKKLQAHLDQLRAKAIARGVDLRIPWEYVPLGDPQMNVGYWCRDDKVSWMLPEECRGARLMTAIGYAPTGRRRVQITPYVPSQHEVDKCLSLAPAKLGAFPIEGWERNWDTDFVWDKEFIDTHDQGQDLSPDFFNYFESLIVEMPAPGDMTFEHWEYTAPYEPPKWGTKRYEIVSPDDWPQHGDVPYEPPVPTITLGIEEGGWRAEGTLSGREFKAGEKIDKIEIVLKGDESTPQEAPSEAEQTEYVEYDMDPAVEVTLDEPEEDPELEPEDDGLYGDQQRYATIEQGDEPSVTREGERGWETWRG